MVARHLQQRRSGHARPRLNFTNILLFAEEHQQSLRPLSSGSPLGNSHNEYGCTSPDSILSSHSGEGISASGSYLQSTVRISEDCVDMSTNLKRLANNVEDTSYLKQIPHCKNGSHNSAEQDACKNVDWNVAVQLEDPLECTFKSGNGMEVHKMIQRHSTRKKKPKVLYEEDSISRKSQKRLRQLRIMRHLGLVAPQGSPFANTRVIRTAT